MLSRSWPGDLLELVDVHHTRNQAFEQVIGKPVMAALDRRVGREYAMFPDPGKIIQWLPWPHILGQEAIPVESDPVSGTPRGPH